MFDYLTLLTAAGTMGAMSIQPQRGPVMVEAEALAAGAWAPPQWSDVVLPLPLVRAYRRAVAAGWSAQVTYVRATELDASGAPAPVKVRQPLLDLETGERLLTARGTPRNTLVVVAGATSVSDTFALQVGITYEGLERAAVALWSQGAFAMALARPPLVRLSSSDFTALLAARGAYPQRQRGVPPSLQEEIAARAARGQEEQDE